MITRALKLQDVFMNIYELAELRDVSVCYYLKVSSMKKILRAAKEIFEEQEYNSVYEEYEVVQLEKIFQKLREEQVFPSEIADKDLLAHFFTVNKDSILIRSEADKFMEHVFYKMYLLIGE